jgi:hypothetical protein
MTGKAEETVIKDDVIDVEVEEEELDNPPKEDDEELDNPPKEGDEELDNPPKEDDDDDEVIVTIGDEAPPQEDEHDQAPEWVRELRKAHRETQRENRELKAKLEATTQTETKPAAVGKKPTLEEFDYDTERYEQELTSWYERKRKADAQAAKQEEDEKKQEQAWQQQLNAYGEKKSKLKVKDFDDAEAIVLETFNQTQQGIVIQGAENPALVFYALGKNHDRIKELASINDPVKFAFAVAKLEKDLKVKNRKAPPAPERKVGGTAPKSGSVDSTLERLRAEAEKTGDYTKVTKYRRQKRQAKT